MKAKSLEKHVSGHVTNPENTVEPVLKFRNIHMVSPDRWPLLTGAVDIKM